MEIHVNVGPRKMCTKACNAIFSYFQNLIISRYSALVYFHWNDIKIVTIIENFRIIFISEYT